jgi:hypothetical protein
MTNDNAIAQTRNASHSVALAAIGGEYVVSCFALGADGEPNVDQELFFRTYTDARIARRIYEGQARLLACSAAEMDAAIERVMGAISSLSSCLAREVPNEARILAACVNDLTTAATARRDARRAALKASVLERAAESLARRTAGLDAKIAAEAAVRASKGQP